MSFVDKIKFFDFFFYVMMIGNIFQIFGSIVAIYQNCVQTNTNILLGMRQACIGLGCMCTWVYLIKYFTYNERFLMTTSILADSTVKVIKFVIGITPVYLAFVFMGRCFFWKTEKFESTQQAFAVLFSMMAGDVLEETYIDTKESGFLSPLYMTFWILLFMSAVHNVFISIISNGFRNKFLEDRYQEMFELYTEGDRAAVSKWNIDVNKV